jgi:hypothetical protein
MFMDVKTKHPVLGARGVNESEFRYRIISVTRSSMRMQIEGESRLTDTGKPVVWDLVMRGRNEYRWHRTDWRYGAYTPPIRQCE